MGWSITSFVLMGIYAYYVFTIKYSDLYAESRSFSDVIFFLTFLLFLHHHFVSPVVHWPEAQGLADYFNSWNYFQVRLRFPVFNLKCCLLWQLYPLPPYRFA